MSKLRPATAFAALLFMILAVIATYPLSFHLGSRVPYEGDPLLNTWIMAYSAPRLVADPRRLFDAPAFVPYEGALAFSEHLLFPSLVSWPVRALSGNPLLAHNVVVLVSVALSGFLMFLLLEDLGAVVSAALVGGALFAFHTFAINEVPRVQILAHFWFPLGLMLVARHFLRPRWTTAVAFALTALCCGLSNNYYQLYMPLLYGSALPWLLTRCPHGEWRRALSLLFVSLLPVLLVFLVLAFPYLATAERLGFRRELPVGIDVQKYFATAHGNLLYGETVHGVRLQTQAAHFIGIAPILLTIVAVASWRRLAERALLKTAIVGTVLFALLSLGQEVTAFGFRLGPGPYRLLYRFIPGFHLIRIPERLSLLAFFWLSILAALGAGAMLERCPRPRRALAALLVVFVFAEHLSVPMRAIRMPVGPEIPEVYRWLNQSTGAVKVAEIPFYGTLLNRLDSLPMYFAVGSNRALVNGYTGFYPPAYAFLRHKLSSLPGPSFLEAVERLGIDHLVVHPHLWPQQDRSAWVSFLDASTDFLRLVWVVPGEARGGEPAWDHGGERIYEVMHPLRANDSAVVARDPIPSVGFSATSSRGLRPSHVIDGDRGTEWTLNADSEAGDFLEVRFGRDIDFRGVRLLLTYPHTGYPGPLRIHLLSDAGWKLTDYDRDRADRELLSSLLRSGADAWYAMDFPETVRARAIRLVVPRADPTLDRWRVAELQLYR